MGGLSYLCSLLFPNKKSLAKKKKYGAFGKELKFLGIAC